MPKQTASQKTGSLGHSIVENQIKRSGLWVARNLTEDYGVDIELEYAPGEVKGKFVKAQIKSHERIKVDKGFIKQNLPKSYLRYCYECRIPIILVVVSTETSESWFMWIQKWVIDSGNVSNIYDDLNSKSLAIRLPIDNDFVSSLEREMVSIANWENSTQLYIALQDLANLSLRLYDDDLSKILFEYLGRFKVNNSADANYLSSLIERVIEMGAAIWGTYEGSKLSKLLFEFIREHGDKLNAQHISKLIIRGDNCSRTGVNALGILYDNFPSHAVSLKLTRRFENFADKRLHYYCTVREKYLDCKGPGWLSKIDNLTIGKIKADFSSIGTSIYDKWANRGDSVILDFVFEVED
jgi:hypothetical protein